MSATAHARSVAQWLPVVLFIGFVAVSALYTNATAVSKPPVVANVAAGDAAAVSQPGYDFLPRSIVGLLDRCRPKNANPSLNGPHAFRSGPFCFVHRKESLP